jgi:diguanylate cyclase (GGDEF)-like protein/PAS domain S-box-containing protein
VSHFFPKETSLAGWITGFSVFTVSITLSAIFIWYFENMRVEKFYADATDIAQENINLLRKNIDQKLALTYPIAALIEKNGTVTNFQSISKKLIEVHPAISEIALVPDGIIKEVVPYSTNKKAIGFNLFTDPQQQAEALLALKTKEMTLAGPLNLIQGGKGLVGRLPVFTKKQEFWGFVLVVIRFPDILNTTAFNNLKKEGYQYTLSRINPTTKVEELIASSGTQEMIRPIEKSVYLPNAKWTLRIAPIEGWNNKWAIALETLIAFLLSALFGYLAKQYVELKHYRYSLQKLVEQRTAEIMETKNQLRTLLNTIPDLIWLKDSEGVYLLCNPMFERFFGAKEEEIVGKTDYDFVDKELADSFRKNDSIAMNAHAPIKNEEWITFAADGHLALLETLKIPMLDEKENLIGILGISHDITERHRHETRIDQLVHYDHLTELPNRALLTDRVNYAIHIAYRANETLSILCLDLDHFKNINDSLGHTVGDELLIQVSQRMQSILREEDTLSRQGGDEFIILLPNTDPNGAAHIAEKVIDTISQPYRIQNHELSITPSVGISLYPMDGNNFETLLQSADAAMYRAKHDGRNCYRFVTAEIQARSSRNLELENALRYALRRNELEVYYQPQISMESGNIIGAEALLRWNHPTMGMVSPAEFITIAEESGQIIAIGEWVLKRALEQLKSWISEGMEPFIMAVNLSAIQFRHPTLVSMVLSVLEELELPASYLELELTEGIAMQNPLHAIEIMNELHAHGVRMSIDDFGTGYSSLNYLKQFKVYKLKIDQSFIRDIAENSEDKTIVNTIINMAHSLNMITIAEGVETAEQLSLLRENGCNEIQGYLYSKPIPAKAFQEYVQQKLYTNV